MIDMLVGVAIGIVIGRYGWDYVIAAYDWVKSKFTPTAPKD